MSDLLMALFYLPTRHLHEYGRLLLKLATCFEVVGGTTRTVLNIWMFNSFILAKTWICPASFVSKTVCNRPSDHIYHF